MLLFFQYSQFERTTVVSCNGMFVFVLKSVLADDVGACLFCSSISGSLKELQSFVNCDGKFVCVSPSVVLAERNCAQTMFC